MLLWIFASLLICLLSCGRTYLLVFYVSLSVRVCFSLYDDACYRSCLTCFIYRYLPLTLGDGAEGGWSSELMFLHCYPKYLSLLTFYLPHLLQLFIDFIIYLCH